MVSDPLTLVNTRVTPQSQRADRRQVQNSAGGYVFQVGDMARLRRFLTLGTTGGTYYVGERELTRDNAQLVIDLAADRGPEIVHEIIAISLAGRAPRQNPTIFALAVCAASPNEETRKAALTALPMVCRTGTHLFLFAKYVEQFRGWGRGLRRAVNRWYLDKPVDKLAYQLIKYRQREGWTHRDLLRLGHPETQNTERRLAFEFALGKLPAATVHVPTAHPGLLLIEAFQRLQAADTPKRATEIVRFAQNRYGLSVPWEAIKPEHLTDKDIWAALLDNGMPQTALMRNLPRLTDLGVLDGDRKAAVAQQLATGMAKAKVHPINVLVALRTYASGHSVRGESTWAPLPAITDALDAGFYEAFGGVEPAGKRTMVALDVSGSMDWVNIAGMPLTPRQASAAMAMVTMATEPGAQAVAFTSGGWASGGPGLTPIDLSARRRLDDIIGMISRLPAGGTDCSLPWRWALQNNVELDTVVTYTDNESWAGPSHVYQAVRQYRERTGIPARHIVVGMTATNWTVNDPSDTQSLDVAGFDSAVPTLISDFSAGRI